MIKYFFQLLSGIVCMSCFYLGSAAGENRISILSGRLRLEKQTWNERVKLLEKRLLAYEKLGDKLPKVVINYERKIFVMVRDRNISTALEFLTGLSLYRRSSQKYVNFHWQLLEHIRIAVLENGVLHSKAKLSNVTFNELPFGKMFIYKLLQMDLSNEIELSAMLNNKDPLIRYLTLLKFNGYKGDKFTKLTIKALQNLAENDEYVVFGTVTLPNRKSVYEMGTVVPNGIRLGRDFIAPIRDKAIEILAELGYDVKNINPRQNIYSLGFIYYNNIYQRLVSKDSAEFHKSIIKKMQFFSSNGLAKDILGNLCKQNEELWWRAMEWRAALGKLYRPGEPRRDFIGKKARVLIAKELLKQPSVNVKILISEQQKSNN